MNIPVNYKRVKKQDKGFTYPEYFFDQNKSNYLHGND